MILVISDKTIFRMSAALAAAGIVALAVLAFVWEPQRLSPDEVNAAMAGGIVEVNGTITSISSSEGHVFMSMGGLRVVMFEKQAKHNPWVYDMKKGDVVGVSGKVAIYKGEVEIIAEEIKNV